MDKVKFLVVEVSTDISKALQAWPKRSELEIIKSNSGNESLELLSKHDFALVIIDVKIPGMDGVELATLMKSSEKTKSIPVILVTSSPADKAFKGYEIGVVDVLSKPLDLQMVLSKVGVFFELGKKCLSLSHTNEDLIQFTDIASHDLKEPLRTISNYLQLLERETQSSLSTDAREYLDFALGASRRMSTLIDSLLSYSQARETKAEVSEVDLGQTLQLVLVKMKKAITDSKATINFDKLPVVLADKIQMEHLLQNLISNAIKFQEGPPQVQLHAELVDDHWKISITDNGIGISPKSVDRIFNPLQRLHGRDEYPGSGMGLAICKRIIERHGGKIWVDPRQSKGTTLIFTLPNLITN